MHELIDGIVDAESFFEVKPLWAPEVIVGLGRLDGEPVGIVANNPRSSAACCSSTRPTSAPGSSGCATRSTSR